MAKEHAKKITIGYRWCRPNGEDIIQNHIEALDETATERINEMMSQGFVAGQLHDNIHMTDSDVENGEQGIEYKGWWGTEILCFLQK